MWSPYSLSDYRVFTKRKGNYWVKRSAPPCYCGTVLDGQERPGMVAYTIISAPSKRRQENGKLKASLGYIVRCSLKEKTGQAMETI